MKKLVYLLLSLFTAQTIFAQNARENENKYWHYRERLQSMFMEISNGNEQGTNIPASSIQDSMIYWGDGNAQLSDYICVLATEYRLLKDNGKDYSQTLNDLRNAINAMLRLDYYAETYYQKDGAMGTPSINGFMVRDDVPENFCTQFSSQNPFFVGKTVNSCYSRMYLSDSLRRNNEMSKDNIWHYLQALALVKKLVDEPDLVQIVKDEAFKMVNQLHQKDWTYIWEPCGLFSSCWPGHKVKVWFTSWRLINPITGNNVYEGSDVDEIGWASANRSGFRYGFAEAGNWVTGFKDGSTNYPTLHDESQTPYNVHFNDAITYDQSIYDTYSYRSLATVAGFDSIYNTPTYNLLIHKRDNDVVHPYEQFPLMFIVLHGKNGAFTLNNSSEKAYYENLLNIAPTEGPYNYGGSNFVMEWSSVNRLVWPESRNDPDPSFKGQYSGLDYMLLYNLYKLVYQCSDYYLSMSSPNDFQYTGGSVICNSGTAFSVSPLPRDIQIRFEASDNIDVIPINSTTSLLKQKGGGANSEGWVRAVLVGKTRMLGLPTKKVWVGHPPSFSISGSSSVLNYQTKAYRLNSIIANSSYYYPEWSSINSVLTIEEPVNTFNGIVTANQAGRGRITASLKNACGESLSSFSISVLASDAKLSPNPTSGNVSYEVTTLYQDNLRTASPTNEICDIKIYNYFQQLVFSSQSSFPVGQLNLSNLRDGIYIVKLTNNDITYTSKLTIKH